MFTEVVLLAVLGLTWDKGKPTRCWDESGGVCSLSLKTEKTFSAERLSKSFFKSPALSGAVAVSQVKCFLFPYFMFPLTPAMVRVTEMVTNHRMFWVWKDLKALLVPTACHGP